MNYERIYNQIIERAKNRAEQRIQHKKQGGYYEGHHIIPKCMGGEGRSPQWYNKNPSTRHPNIVGLTPREHFLVHRILIKIYPDNLPLVRAFWMMCNSYNDRVAISSRTYEEVRENIYKMGLSEETKKRISVAGTGRKHTPEAIEKIRAASKNRKQSEETKQKLSALRKGKKLSEETIKKMSQSLKGRKTWNKGLKTGPQSEAVIANRVRKITGKKRTDEQRKRISDSMKGHIISNETREKISKKLKGNIPWNKGLKSPNSFNISESNGDILLQLKFPNGKPNETPATKLFWE